jgi:hypothetical protein
MEMKNVASLRYNIAERLENTSRQKANDIRRYIITHHRIGTTTWYDWLKIGKADRRDIPSIILRDIATMMGISMEQLFNK